jgi:hypothetical protein
VCFLSVFPFFNIKVRVRVNGVSLGIDEPRTLTLHTANYIKLAIVMYICKIQIDVQSLIDVQFSNIWPFVTFSNRCPMTSQTYGV